MKKGKSYQQPVNEKIMTLIQAWIEKHDLKYGVFLFYPEQTFLRTKNSSDKKRPAHYVGMRQAAQKVFDKLYNVGIPTTEVMVQSHLLYRFVFQ